MARANADTFEGVLSGVEFVEADVTQLTRLPRSPRLADTIVTNPPFGTRCKGADTAFLESAFGLAPGGVVYSMHKTSTRDHLSRVGRRWGITECGPVVQMLFDVPASYKWHKDQSRDIEVDIWRFVVPERTPLSPVDPDQLPLDRLRV